jgi:periplasmic protein TonB
MIRDTRLFICAGLSIVGHLALANGLGHLPRRTDTAKRIISLRVVSPPPSLEPPPEPAAVPQAAAPKQVTHVRSRVHAAAPPTTDVPKQEAPPPERPSLANTGPSGPVFGVTMESTSQAGSGPSMPIGNSGGAEGASDDGVEHGSGANGKGKGLMAPVPAYQVTTMPLPQGRCIGKYTDEAKRAAIEGTVILDLIVSETGRARDIRVVSGLEHGLTDAAIAAIKECRFTPGEKDGTPVAVRVRGFKIRFLLQNDE